MSEAFESYKLFTALTQHFTTAKYDFIKFRGKSYADKHARQFDKRGDRFFYYKVWSRYKEELKGFYISVLIEGDKVWIGDLLDDKYHTQYNDWLKRQQSITKVFKDDVETIVEFMSERELSFKDMLVADGTKMPMVVRLQEQKFISIETLVIINRLTKITEKCECSHPFWSDKKLLLTKYQPFVKVSKLGKFASMLKDGIDKLG